MRKEKMMKAERDSEATSKTVVLAVFAIFIFGLGLLLRDLLIFVSLPVAMYLGFVFLLGENFGSTVQILRTIEKSQINEDETLSVRLRVKNLGRSQIPIVNVEDTLPEELFDSQITEPCFTIPSLEPGETREMYYALRGKSFGIFKIGPLLVANEDSSGFRRIERVIDSFSSVVVLPSATERLSHFKIRPRKTKPWPGEIVARKVGLGMDNYSIRQYIPGDSFKRINWRASARFTGQAEDDQLLLNEKTAELGADTIIVVDARPVSNVGSDQFSTVVSSIHSAISITDKLLKDRNRVGLVTIGLNSERIPPGYGRRQYTRLLLSLIKVRSGEYFTFENLSRYLRFFYPNLAQIIFISPLIDEDSFQAAAEIARSGYDLIALSPNPIDYSSLKKGASRDRLLKISVALAELSRRANMVQLEKAQVLVIDWRKGEPLDRLLTKNVTTWSHQPGLRSNIRSF